MSPVVHCPDCKAELGLEARTCLQCGADVGLWPESQRTPLILPGNPALSVDVVRKKTSVPKIVAGTTLVAAILGSVLYYMPEKETEDLPPLAAAAPSSDSAGVQPAPTVVTAAPAPAAPATEPVTADSLAAFSYGDTALSRTVPNTPAPRVTPSVATPAPAAAPAVVRAAAPKVTPPPARTPAAEPTRATTRVAAATPTTARTTPAARPAVAPAGQLTLTPVISNTLRPGERLQLRWTVLDRRTRRPVPNTRVEFTSTDAAVANVSATGGLVTARTPGTARIIIDAGAAGRSTVSLVVRAPAPIPTVSAAPAVVPEPSRTTATTAAPPAAVTAAPPAVSGREAPRVDLPDANDVRSVVDRFVRDVRRDAVRNFEITQFLADGADHRVIVVSGPNVVSSTSNGVRVAFDLRFTKFDGGGRPVTRVSSISMDVDKRDGTPSSSAVAIGALRRP